MPRWVVEHGVGTSGFEEWRRQHSEEVRIDLLVPHRVDVIHPCMVRQLKDNWRRSNNNMNHSIMLEPTWFQMFSTLKDKLRVAAQKARVANERSSGALRPCIVGQLQDSWHLVHRAGSESSPVAACWVLITLLPTAISGPDEGLTPTRKRHRAAEVEPAQRQHFKQIIKAN